VLIVPIVATLEILGIRATKFTKDTKQHVAVQSGKKERAADDIDEKGNANRH
jgi:Mg-chelatase subunit ChlI